MYQVPGVRCAPYRYWSSPTMAFHTGVSHSIVWRIPCALVADSSRDEDETYTKSCQQTTQLNGCSKTHTQIASNNRSNCWMHRACNLRAIVVRVNDCYLFDVASYIFVIRILTSTFQWPTTVINCWRPLAGRLRGHRLVVVGVPPPPSSTDRWSPPRRPWSPVSRPSIYAHSEVTASAMITWHESSHSLVSGSNWRHVVANSIFHDGWMDGW